MPGGDSDVIVDTCAETLKDICTNGLIGLVLNTVAPPPDEPSGYGCWAGTSFSAPLVSGLAALVLERRGPQPLASILADVTGAAGPAAPVIHYGGHLAQMVRNSTELR